MKITIEEVRAAYQKTGFQVKAGHFVSEDCISSCPISALHYSSLNMEAKDIRNPFRDNPIKQWANSKYGANYTDGFTGGFDGKPISWYKNKEELVGYQNGKAIREALLQ